MKMMKAGVMLSEARSTVKLKAFKKSACPKYFEAGHENWYYEGLKLWQKE